MTQALGNITSANSVLVLGVEQLYPVGVQLTNFATDQMLSSDDMEIAQVRMGVDGGMASSSPAILSLSRVRRLSRLRGSSRSWITTPQDWGSINEKG